ncbi:hypothetical protein ACN9MN_13090 [Chryseobacterium sp. S-02]|uniref:hypothetical protein n=1 Tax=Chryseobacterium sp. S-02 TaxID=3404064 RepID=UPI003CF623F8
MIVGNGLIAKSLKNIDSENTLFFASGVSNSLETKDFEFQREFDLLKKNIEQHSDMLFIYFSTLSINDKSKADSFYVQHKKKIEEYIQNHSKQFTILRIGNIVGRGGNPNTLFNYLKHQIAQNAEFVLHTKARRLLVDIEDISEFIRISNHNIQNKIIDFSYPYHYDLKEIIVAIENMIKQKAFYKEIEDGDFYKIDFEDQVKDFFTEKDASMYLKKLAEKYI